MDGRYMLLLSLLLLLALVFTFIFMMYLYCRSIFAKSSSISRNRASISGSPYFVPGAPWRAKHKHRSCLMYMRNLRMYCFRDSTILPILVHTVANNTNTLRLSSPSCSACFFNLTASLVHSFDLLSEFISVSIDSRM
uniref:Uncharacterized protein n=1 Tax=Cacopsylla melanoneura TaxID=428564 RepID=A0A8D8S3P3_9HEMI